MPAQHLGRTRMAGLGAAALVALFAGALPATAQPAVAPASAIVNAGVPDAVKDSYIVVLKDSSPSSKAGAAGIAALAARHQVATVEHTYHSALSGFAATMSEQQARQFAADPDVAYVEQNRTVRASTEQTSPGSWGIDRIDQLNLPLNSRYGYPDHGGAAVRAYVIDSGIRFTHAQFGGRATSGFDAIDGGPADDCIGHGTHVAGTIGGSNYGVAKRVRLIAVRVLGCNGSGSTAGVIAGVDWVTDNHIAPAVANMSLGGGPSTALDAAVRASIAAGVTYTIAAGNDDDDACDYSPARVPTAITVGASGRDDARADFSNTGNCVDMFAPGVGITSAWNGSNTDTETIDGTSMAAPHIAGAAALTLQVHPQFTPARVQSALERVGSTKVTDGENLLRAKLVRVSHGAVTWSPLQSKCVDVRGGATANRTPVQLFQCNGTTAQQWQWTGVALYNPRSNRCAEAAGGGTINRTPVQIFDCNGFPWQSWTQSVRTLRNDGSLLCLDLPGGVPNDSVQLQIFECNGTQAQWWTPPVN